MPRSQSGKISYILKGSGKIILIYEFFNRCIGSLLSELDGPWAGYVEGVERLTKVDADVALRELETKVSKAIMYALENRAVSENKVTFYFHKAYILIFLIFRING